MVFGDGAVGELSREIDRLGARQVLVLTTPQQRGDGDALAAGLGAGVYAGATMHTPVGVTEDALKLVQSSGVDCLVALGGGSTIGLSKAIALRTDLPQIAIPTTYAGSEMTPILGETRDGRKTTQKSPKVLPEVVLYDVGLTMTLPAGLSGTSGINAIAHSVEAMYAEDSNPIIGSLAEQSIAALVRALPRIAADPGDREARSDAQYGAFLAGVCLGSVGMALHHKLCHTLGGMFDLPIPRRTRSSCRTRWPITARPCRAPWRRWRGRWARTTCRVRCSIWPARSARRARCATSACRKAGSTRPPTRRSPTHTGIRGRWSGRRSAS